jgi:hypothetical protein
VNDPGGSKMRSAPKIMCRSGSSSAVGAVQYPDIYDFVLALGAQAN